MAATVGLGAFYHAAHRCHAALAVEQLNPWQEDLLTSNQLNNRGQSGVGGSDMIFSARNGLQEKLKTRAVGQ